MKLIYLVLIGSFIAILPIILLKKYIKEQNNIYLLVSLLSYLALMRIYIELFNNGEVSKTHGISQVIQLLVVMMISVLFFNESLTKNKIIGLIAGLISIYFLCK
jgi:uncharacterized membrane protein